MLCLRIQKINEFLHLPNDVKVHKVEGTYDSQHKRGHDIWAGDVVNILSEEGAEALLRLLVQICKCPMQFYVHDQSDHE